MKLEKIGWFVIILSILALITGSMLVIHPTTGSGGTNKRRGSQLTGYLPLLTEKHPHNEGSKAVTVLGGNATIIAPEDFDPLREYSMAAAASEMVAERLSQWRDVLLELLRKEFTGNYSEEFVRALERARTGKYNSYLWPVLEWMDRGMTNAQMINEVLERMHRLTRQLSEYRFREGGLLALCGYMGGTGPCTSSPRQVTPREYSMAAAASEMVAERLSQWRDVLLELLRKEFTGNYSEEFVRALERARTGKYNSYLWPVLEWMDRGMTNAQMINEVLERMHRLTRQLSEYRFREGGLYVGSLISKGGTFVLTYCDPPGRVLTTGWNYLHDFERGGWVWVGCFSSSIPNVGHFIGQYCAYTYTTSMSYYWNLARQRCGSSTRSIQVKWFYRAYPMPPDDDWKHDFIWEGNKNEWSEWYTYGDPFTDTSPDPGYYYIKANYYYVLWCCGSSANYCNTHCGRCFSCDRDATQHFIGRP